MNTYLIKAKSRKLGDEFYLFKPSKSVNTEYSFLKHIRRNVRLGDGYSREEATRLTSDEAIRLLDVLEERFGELDRNECISDDEKPWITAWCIVPSGD